MAGTCNIYAATPGSGGLVVSGGFGGNEPGYFVAKGIQYGLSSVTENTQGAGSSTSGGGTIGATTAALAADTTYLVRCTADFELNWGFVPSGTGSGKTAANAATMPAPGSSAVTASTATITSNTYTPNVVTSTYTVYLVYKKTSDPDYTLATSGTSNPLTANLTGLTASTQYQFFAYIVRTTANDTTAYSSVGSFTTLAGEPSTVTNAASSVGHGSATLNQTVTRNDGTNVTVYWKYGVQNPPTDTTTASQAASSDGAYSVEITGLTASTLYYAQAFTAFDTPSGSPNEGAVVNFTTSSNPAAEAADEDHMTIQEYDAVYGVQKAFVFLAASPAATSSNVFLSAAAPWATTECRITIDGGAVADCTNAPTRIGTSAFYTITLTAAELQGENIWVHISDSAVAARDVALHIRTSQELGKMVLNAAQMTNTTALLATGVGSGHGISGVAGATGNDINGVLGNHVIRKAIAQGGGASTITLDASASATNDFYNGSLVVVISGTGTAQARTITDYDGTSKVATVHKAWGTNPAASAVFIIVPAEDVMAGSSGVELASIPTAASSWSDKLNFIWERFAYKRTETATVFTQYKADSSTALGTAAVSDDGTTQTHAKLS